MQAAAPVLLDHRPGEPPVAANGDRARHSVAVGRDHHRGLAVLGGAEQPGGGVPVLVAGRADGRAGRVEQPADVAQHVVGGGDQVGQVGQAGDAAEDQGGRPAEALGAVQVGVDAVAHHQVRAGADGRRGLLQQGPLRLAGDLGLGAGGRPQQGQGGAGAGPDPVGGRKRGVGVAAHEPGAGPDGQGRVPDLGVGQVGVEPDRHHLGVAPGVDQPGPGPLESLAEPGPADHHDPDPLQAVAAAEEAHRRLGRGQDLPGCRLDPQPVQPLHHQLGRPVGVVGHERDPGPEPADLVERPRRGRDDLVAEVDDPVEVEHDPLEGLGERPAVSHGGWSPSRSMVPGAAGWRPAAPACYNTAMTDNPSAAAPW